MDKPIKINDLPFEIYEYLDSLSRPMKQKDARRGAGTVARNVLIEWYENKTGKRLRKHPQTQEA